MNRLFLGMIVLGLSFVACAPSNSIAPNYGEVVYHSQNKPSNENRSSSFTQEIAVILIDYLGTNSVPGFERMKYQANESLITHTYARLVFNARLLSNPNSGSIRSVWTLRDRGDYYFSLSGSNTSNLEIPAKLDKLENDMFNYLGTIFDRVSGNR
jgi:hypothetical protein